MRTLQPRLAISLHHHHARHSILSRRSFLGGSGAAVGALAGGVLAPGKLAAKTANAAPNPIPGGDVTVAGIPFHVYGFGKDKMPATINDFNGFVGVAEVQGTGTATNPDGSTETLLFDTDMRFMKGTYMAVDGAMHHG